ncbi:K Homology domain-containing protein [Pleurotus pulmonarius]
MATPLSAADLQKKHNLEGAPDPFPSLNDTPVKVSSSTPVPSRQELDTSSHTAFPSLSTGAPATNGTPKAAWGNGPRIKPTAVKPTGVTETFTLGALDLSSGRDGKPATLGEVMKQVMAKYKVKLEASGNQKTRQTTFQIKADTQKDLDKAKRSLIALLSPITTRILQAPASTIASIIGPKGATLKQIRDQTGVRVDIPPKDSLAPPAANVGASGASSGKATPVEADEDEEPMIPITLTGSESLVDEAQALLNQIISQKTSKSTQRVRDIPEHILPFVIARRSTFIAVAEGGDVQLQLNQAASEITVSGDREVVTRVIESIKTTIEGFKASLSHIKYPLPKRQHRLLLGKSGEEIMAKSKCAVVVPKPDDPTEDIVIWGAPTDLGGAVGAVITQANSQHIEEVPIPGSIDIAKRLVTYLTRIQYVKSLTAEHPAVNVYLPTPAAAAEKAQKLTIDVVGDKAAVEPVASKIRAFFAALSDAIAVVPVDFLVHRALQGKNAKRWKQLYDAHNVNVYFPNESAEDSNVFLVYDTLSPVASTSSVDKKKHLDEVSQEISKLAKEVADVKSETITVDKKWHDAVAGPNGTTLNAIIGEDKALSIKIGAEAGDLTSQDVIKVRGTSADVSSAIKKILEIVEKAKNDEIENSYSTTFEIDREYVGRIVGSQGSGINKLRDQLGVKVDVSDEPDNQDKEGGKKKKAVHQKSKVTIVGRKENAEEAKKRIQAHVDRMADETSEILKIPPQFHPSLIGQSGKYAIRLEDKYSVKITFPRSSPDNGEGRTREPLKADEVLVKGGRKGVAGAKQELLDALQFEKEANEVIKFSVPNRAVARILGRGGATVNEIKNNTGAAIDVVKGSDADSNTTITLRGTSAAINEAKAAILEISNSVVEEVTETVNIETKFHRTIIGAGGQGLKELIARCGGPSDQKAQAGLIRFPRPGEPSDDVVLRGEAKLVQKLKAEVEKVAAELRDRVVLGVDIPAIQHRAMIGRGGQHLNELQERTHTQVQFPGSRSYNQVGDPENAEELKDADPANIIKVSGPRAACLNAIESLKAQVRPPPAAAITDTIEVPLKYHHAISQQGQFFRTLRSFGVQIDQSAHPQKSAIPTRPEAAPAPTARIDEVEEDVETGVQWEVIPNYQDAEEGDSTWTLKAHDQAGLEQALKSIADAIAQAERMTHVGFLTLPNRSSFPKIVGTKGSNVSRLRVDTGADITVSRDTNTIVIIGAEADILAAKDAILNIASNPGRGQRRNRD